ncbi:MULTISPECIES: DUF6415 family natural product biosynthesis protein [unclassified Streptomyces]|uniref:DUF6415 family natural product biosynthesis protein n=1 Tax=unclassified Streptomyces TaxID=2593676 RepID=UPI00088168A0|nr:MULTISPECIES: DUF6415 family natural product biosynthesis protein [unclassified Streptomyces]PBC86136.1 hypothetical protein BX261_6207 [Streptomyces sp. 2321.6]SDQ95169.1 hypothetical protein SAMN05216511_1047 [Streptomyces sp. KS_16]SED79814.1 hypothetical protein SAMN05428954_1022 [Streptomyces sp. 2112.3]SED89347.1 hypothetical protein SAMN05428940_6233 [Streptomyces sp. 2133.1]SNC73016.1 hypothetical protein SAMN06272741_6133 [Streptomyces sp. 2114.4]
MVLSVQGWRCEHDGHQAELQTNDRTITAGELEAIDLLAIEETITSALGASRGQLQVSMLVGLRAQLRGHIALLREPARKAVDRMWHGGVEWHRHITRLDSVERQAAQELSSLPLGALIEVQLMARDCQWLLDGYREGWR